MLNIRVHQPKLNDSSTAIKETERALHFALDRFAHIVREVEVSLTDINGPRGGCDKMCKIQVRLIPRGMKVVRTIDSTFEQAANTACDKLTQILAKRLCKRKSQLRELPVDSVNYLQ